VDVIDLLSGHQTFTVEPYRPKMDPSVGPFMLARDGREINWHEKSVMRSHLRWDDLPNVRRVAKEATPEGLAEATGTVELVSAVGRRVPLRVVQRYFGFPGPDDASMLRWSKATQSDMKSCPRQNPLGW
jgi:cytochrome P450